MKTILCPGKSCPQNLPVLHAHEKGKEISVLSLISKLFCGKPQNHSRCNGKAYVQQHKPFKFQKCINDTI